MIRVEFHRKGWNILKEKIRMYLENPLFLFCFIPGFYLLFGTLYAIQYIEINWVSFALLYAFVLFNQLIEGAFKKKETRVERMRKSSVLFVEGLIVLSLFYFGIVHSIFLALALLCYSLMIQGQYLFAYYQLPWISIALTSLFKGIFMNSISFSIHSHFIPMSVLIWTIPLLLPILLMEIKRWNIPLSKKQLITILLGSYLIALPILFYTAGLVALILLLSVPFALLSIQTKQKETVSLFTASFLLLHFILSLLTFI